jgi:hypothetical protein
MRMATKKAKGVTGKKTPNQATRPVAPTKDSKGAAKGGKGKGKMADC